MWNENFNQLKKVILSDLSVKQNSTAMGVQGCRHARVSFPRDLQVSRCALTNPTALI